MRLDAIKPIYQQDGPFVTVYAEVGRNTEDAVAQREARWTTLRHQLEHAGVPSSLIADLGDLMNDNTHLEGEVRRTVVASGDSIVFDDVQPGHTHWPEMFDIAPLPDLSGWLAAADASRSFLLVNTDRVRADISLHRALPGPPDAERSVDGDDFYITKVAEGDWAQKQFQQTAENTWKHNASLVADEARTLARRHGTTATLIAGETRARSEVARALELDAEALAPVIEIESGGRAAGASSSALWDEVTEVVTGLAREHDTDIAARLAEARGRGEGAATGLDDVVAALAQSRVEHLVVDMPEFKGRTISTERFGGIPLPDGALGESELPADRALVAAAALTGASLNLLPSAMSHGGGVAALLRWT